jgi:hypothetical protein
MYVKIDRAVVPDIEATPAQLPYVPGKSLAELPDLRRALDSLTARVKQKNMRSAAKKAPVISENARKLLDLAAMYPFHPVGKLWSQLGLVSPSVQGAARTELEEGQLAEFDVLRLGKLNVIIIGILDKGWQLLNRQPSATHGRGHLAHRTISHWIQMVGDRRSYDRALTEWEVSGTFHHVDAAWCVGGSWQVFEVVFHADNLVHHLQKCLLESSAVSNVSVVACQKSELKQLKELIEAERSLHLVLDCVLYVPADTFYKELWP